MNKSKLKLASLFICLCTVFVALAACYVDINLQFMVDDTLYQTVNTQGNEVIVMPQDPSEEGYVFVGWFWDKGEWKQPFTANSLMDKPLTQTMSVYARLVKTEDYLAGLEANFKGFDKVDDTTFSLIVANSADILQLNSSVEVHHETSWVLASDMSGLNIIPSKTVSLEVGDNTFYVLVSEIKGAGVKLYTIKIRRKPIYTLSFNTAGGEPVEEQYVEEGAVAEFPSATREGYDFVEWNYDFDEPVYSDTTVTAKWSPVSYTVAFDANGGTEKMDAQSFKYDAAQNLSANKFERAGYSFTGWSLDKNSAVIDYENSEKLLNLASTNTVVTLYANWELNPFTVTYNLDGGKNNSANPAEFALGDSVTLQAPTKSGYSFEGWYFDNSFKSGVSGELPYASAEVYARWIKGTNIIFVGENDTYKTVQSAIDAAKEGSTVFVRAGAYAEEIIIGKGITLLGNNYGRMDGADRLPESIIHPVSNESFNVSGSSMNIEITAGNVTVDGLTLDGDNPEIKNILTAELKNAFTQGSSGWYTYNKAGLNVGDDLHIDGYRGIGVSTFNSAHLNNVIITNNIIKNYNHAGVIMESALKNVVASDLVADTNGVNAIVSSNIISNIAGYGEFKAGAPYGTYGRGIICDGNMNVRIEKNKVSGCLAGMMYTRIYAKSDTAYTVIDNEFTDNSIGIWLNSNGGVTEAQTTKPGDKYVIMISQNRIYLSESFKSVVPFYFPGDTENISTFGIVVSTTERTTMDIRIESNVIENVKYAVMSGNIPADTLKISKNNINNVSVGVLLSNFILGYDFKAYNNHTIAFENTVTDSGKVYEIMPLNTGKVAILYSQVDILDENGNVVLTIAADINSPLNSNTVLFEGNYISEFYTDPVNKALPLPTLDICSRIQVYADWKADVVTRVEVLTAPTTSVYKMATAALTVTKGVIRVYYSSGRYVDISMGSGTTPAAGITFGGFEERVRGFNTITVSYEGHSATFDIYVKLLLTMNQNIDGNGGGTTKTLEYSEGEITAPTKLTRTGYTLEGYYLDTDYTVAFDGVMPEGNLTIYAKWIKN